MTLEALCRMGLSAVFIIEYMLQYNYMVLIHYRNHCKQLIPVAAVP